MSFHTAVLIASLDQLPHGHIQDLHILIDSMMKSFNCPLSSRYACELWPYIVKVAIPVENTGNMILYKYNRLHCS